MTDTVFPWPARVYRSRLAWKPVFCSVWQVFNKGLSTGDVRRADLEESDDKTQACTVRSRVCRVA